MADGWQIFEWHGVPHAVPLHDHALHFSFECPCNPKEINGVIVHNAFDGREPYEPVPVQHAI